MSGGVDSSVAAALLKDRGYECVGVFMRVGSAGAGNSHQEIGGSGLPQARRLKHGCCSAEDAFDARAIAGRLGIPFYVLNFQPDFDRIIEYFVDEYARARTPNPCVMCNIHLKFGKLLRYADMLDAEFVATGHYARLVRENETCYLARARNPAKDQSYVLFGVSRENLRRCLFPLGEMADKAEVRRIAADLGLKVHDKPESQEICFVPDGDYKQLVRARRPETERAGEVRHADGRVLGRHDGIAGYTIGQRRGLRIAAGSPIYVTNLDPTTNTVTVGPREDLLSGGLIATDVNWLTALPAVGTWVPVQIKIRHQHTAVPGRMRRTAESRGALDEAVEAQFRAPQAAVTPGQAAVFYREDGVVLAGGWISRALPPDAAEEWGPP